MDNGIASHHTGVIKDPDFRFEIYMDWKSILSREPGYDPKLFTKDKGIPFESLEDIVREFDSYDPTGERWGFKKIETTKK